MPQLISATGSPAKAVLVGLLASFVLTIGSFALISPAGAQLQPDEPVPTIPEGIPDEIPSGRAQADPTSQDDEDDGNRVTIDIGTPGEEPSDSVLLIIGLSIISLAPSLVILLSSFTRIVVVLSLTRNALGLQGVPPNQVIVGLALFLSLFVMGPTLQSVNDDALQPYLDGTIEQGEAYDIAVEPMREFMLDNTRGTELEMLIEQRADARPETPADIPLTTVIPAFILSELKTAFLMGFVIFIPFLIIDVVVASVLMSLGMMMLPPVFVSLPFKLLLFVLVGGWSLIVEVLLTSYL